MSSDLIYIFGGGGHGKVVIDLHQESGGRVAAVFDDGLDPGTKVLGHVIAGRIEEALPQSDIYGVVAIGNNRVRKRVVDLLESKGHNQWASIFHPRSHTARSALLGTGTCVHCGAAVMVDARIGNHVIINTNVCVDHDCVIDDFAHVACGATLAGGVIVGEGALIGAGATVLPGVAIGPWATVGAGATVTKNVEAGTVVVGTPAKVAGRLNTDFGSDGER